MFDAERFKARLDACNLSQGALARRVGVSQQTISRLANGERYGSRHLHRIARELGTTPAYLMGETNDPAADAPPEPELDWDDRTLVEQFHRLSSPDRAAILRIVTAMATVAETQGKQV